ncbi:hypothetical protein QC823_05140 [Halomonas vilamensis]|uniref:Phasin domain-containing protein n=1 Tax=Vreelandella vilamensis TaxID=531309 RepID=A0ABU1H2M3_9GAMM|nr:hypothetical protein [Halomonas vilamensis]MDR5898375.1 hypothetical protein [Halomonas vilamensis]
MAKSTHTTQFEPLASESLTPWLSISQPVFHWWMEQSVKGVQPLMNVQLAWLESVSSAIQMEMEFCQAIAESHEKITNCLLMHHHSPKSAEEITDCYQQAMQGLSEAHLDRLKKVTELSNDFRSALWEEI